MNIVAADRSEVDWHETDPIGELAIWGGRLKWTPSRALNPADAPSSAPGNQ
jgi:hypothetical protein